MKKQPLPHEYAHLKSSIGKLVEDFYGEEGAFLCVIRHGSEPPVMMSDYDLKDWVHILKDISLLLEHGTSHVIGEGN